MQKLQTVNAETLLYEPLEKPSFVVDSLIPTGLSLFCGSQKIGKSWLMLKLCLCVSQGIPLWDMTTMEGDVLYLCLEDTFCRIQDRLFRLTDEASGRLHFAVASCKLSDGLIVQLEDYLKDHPDSRLIVIDTLQKVRTASKDNAYASDYGDISLIKDFADRHSLAVIVVHHIRKQNDSDVFNKVSGTTGLTGSADATFVLEKEKRASDTAKLYVTGRDTPYQEYTLRFRDCSWELVERKTQEQLAKETIPDVLFRLVDFMRDKEEWAGTATELLAAMGETETIPTVITKGHFLCLVSAKFSMGVASFIVQYRITKLLKSTLFVKLPAIRFHILTSFLVGKLVVLPPFSRGNTAFFKNAEDFLKFLQKFFERTKCARPKSPDGRIGIVSSIQMIRQFIYISVVSPGGGRAFFDKSITVGFCRYAFCFMAATSFSRRFQQ